MTFRLGLSVLLLLTVHSLRGVSGQNGQDSLSRTEREYNAGHYNQAVDLLTAAVKQSPDNAHLHFMLGQSYYQLHDYSHATVSFERCVQLAQDNSEYHDWLGKAYGRRAEEAIFLSEMGLARKSHKEFELAVQLDPSNLEAQRDLIRFETYAPGIAGGGDDRALKDIEALSKIDALQGQLAQGEYLSARKKFAEADAAFAKILESSSDRIGVYLEAAEYYRDRRNAVKMGEALASAERIDADDRRLKYYRGVFLVMSGKNTGEAESSLKSYLATVPSNADLPDHSSALEWLGRLYEAQGKPSEAAEEYRSSLTLDPHNKDVSEALKRVEKK